MKHNSHSSPSEHVISEPNHQNMKKKIWEWFIMMIADGLDIVWCTAFNCVYMENINWGNLSFVSFNAWEWWSDPQTSEYYVAAPIFTRLTNKLPIYQYLQPHTASLHQKIYFSLILVNPPSSTDDGLMQSMLGAPAEIENYLDY